MVLLEISNLKRDFEGRPLWNPFSFSFPSKGIYLLEGENGSGKTTFLEILDILDLKYEGSVKYEGKELKELSPKEINEIHGREILYIPQRHFLNQYLYDYRKKDSDFSEGEKMMFVLQKELKKERKAFLLDEVTANLDEKNSMLVWEQIRELSKNSLVLLITHDQRIMNEDVPRLVFKGNKIAFFDSKIGKEEKENVIPSDSLAKEKKDFKKIFLKIQLSSIAMSIVSFFVMLFTFIILEFPVAFTTYDFNPMMRNEIRIDDVVFLNKEIYGEKGISTIVSEDFKPANDYFIADTSIPDDNTIHGRNSTLAMDFPFNADFTQDDQVELGNINYVNPNFIDRNWNLANLKRAITIAPLSYRQNGSVQSSFFRFYTLDLFKRKNPLLPLGDIDPLKDNEFLTSKGSITDGTLHFLPNEDFQKDIEESDPLKNAWHPDLSSLFPEGLNRRDLNISMAGNFYDDEIILSDNAMERLLEAIKPFWFNSFYVRVTEKNKDFLLAYIDTFQAYLSCVKRGFREYDKNVSGVWGATDNPYSIMNFAMQNQRGVGSNMTVLLFVAVPSSFLVLFILVIFFKYLSVNERHPLLLLYSRGMSKTRLLLCFTASTLVVLTTSFLVAFPLSVLAWGGNLTSSGMGFMPSIQWPMVLLLLGFILTAICSSCFFLLGVFKKR